MRRARGPSGRMAVALRVGIAVFGFSERLQAGKMSQERYFLHVDGVQRGPYTVRQIGHMVNSGIVHSGAMFWCEGLEQWQPVTQLIEPDRLRNRRRIRVGARTLAACGVMLGLFWLVLPTLRQGWKEQHQVERTPEAAYWRARGVLREHVGWFTGLHFKAFDPEKVQMEGQDAATVEIEAESVGMFKGQAAQRWRVNLMYDKRLQMWVPIPEEKAP